MNAFLRKYGAAAVVDGVTLIEAASNSFKANPTLAAGDVTISKDGGAFAAIEGEGTFGDFVAVAPAAGTSVQIKPDAAALTCKRLVIRLIDQTGPQEWQDRQIIVETYGHVSAMRVMDFGKAALDETIWSDTKAAFLDTSVSQGFATIINDIAWVPAAV